MKIIKGRGKHRVLEIEVPDSSVVRRSPVGQQRALVDLVCDLIYGHAKSLVDDGA